MILEVITPERSLVSGLEVDDVVVPSGKGEIEVLAHHSDYQSVLSAGELRFKDGGKLRRFAVSYGFVKIEGERISVLAETCEESHEIDVDRALKAEKSAQMQVKKEVKGELAQSHFKKYQLKLQRAVIRQNVAGK